MQTTTESSTATTGEHWMKDPAGAFGAWDRWSRSTRLPIHEGYFIPDLRTLALGWWEERQCHAAFLKLAGQEGVSEGRVTEIPAGQTLPRLKLSIDEAVYVVEGRGQTSISKELGGSAVSFEWQRHSLFRLPRHHYHQLSSLQGRVDDLARDQIEYTDEDPYIRQTFEEQLAQRGRTSRMPEAAYLDRTYQWTAEE